MRNGRHFLADFLNFIIKAEEIAQLDQNYFVLYALELTLLIPQYFLGSAYLLVDFLLKSLLKGILGVVRAHIPAERQSLIQTFDTALDDLRVLVLLLLAHLDAGFTET